MNVQFLIENNRKRFAILPYADFARLVEMATDEADTKRALKILKNKEDAILLYEPHLVLENPIRKKRLKMGLTQAELARKMKVDTSYVSRIERDGRKISHATLNKAAWAFGCDSEELT